MKFKNKGLLKSFLERDIQKLVVNIAQTGEEKLKENLMNDWYRHYPINRVYIRMYEDGGVLGAVQGNVSSDASSYMANIAIDPSKIRKDRIHANGRTYGRHQTYGGVDLRTDIIGWMEEGGRIRDREEGAHMLEKTAEWVENEISSVNRINMQLSRSGSNIRLTASRKKK